MAYLVSLFYAQTVEGAHTTYNVGAITGGSTVNSIASSCEITYEYRALEKAHLDAMRRKMDEIVARCREKGISLTLQLVGSRPCGTLDSPMEQKMVSLCRQSILDQGGTPTLGIGSNDCNIPLSLGIPAICPGLYEGGLSHTRKEYVKLSSLEKGYRALFAYLLRIAQRALG